MNGLQLNHASEITRLHNEVATHLRASLENALRIGELLVEQKASLRHGDFGHWIEEHLPFSDRTARNYMKLYEHRDRLKTETVSDLNDAYRLLRQPQLPAGTDTVAAMIAPAPEGLPDWMPAVGEMNAGHCRLHDNDAQIALVHDQEIAGYVRIYLVEYNDIDEGGMIEGFRRGVGVDRVPRMLEYLHVDPSLVEWWGRAPLEGNDAYAECLYDLLEPNWLRRAKART